MLSRKSTNFSSPSKRTAVRPRGLLIEGIWHCDCEPREPASHFQTKNGGKNHGRWFYTCQKPQKQRCGFFIWDDEARARGQNTLFLNSRSERETRNETTRPGTVTMNTKTPITPSKSVQSSLVDFATGLPTPTSGVKRRRDSGDNAATVESPTKKPRSSVIGDLQEDEDEDSFGWDDDLEDEMVEKLSSQETSQISSVLPSTPQKKMGMGYSKDNGSESLETGRSSFLTPGPHGDSQVPDLSTQKTPTVDSRLSDSLSGPPSTPTSVRFTPNPRAHSPTTESKAHCALVSDTLSLLSSHKVAIPPAAKQELISLLNTHDLRTQGILRGRDISRLGLKKKDGQIQVLNGRIAVLEAEREVWKMRAMRREGNDGG